MCNLQIQWTKV